MTSKEHPALDIEKIEKRADEATPQAGWKKFRYDVVVAANGNMVARTGADFRTKAETKRLTDFIANAPNDVRALLQEVRLLREALKPFAALGNPFTKANENDDSEWTRISDETFLRVGQADIGWNRISVGDCRRARALLPEVE